MKWANHPLIRHGDFRSFYLGNVLMNTASRSLAMIFAWWLISSGGSDNGTELAVLMMMQTFPLLVISPFIGPFIDRHDKKKCMLAGAAVQTLFLAITCYLFVSDDLSYWGLCLLFFAISAFIPLVDSSASSAVEQLVPEESLASASSLQASVLEFGNIIAALVSTSLMAAAGLKVALVSVLGVYGAGMAFIAAIGRPLKPVAVPAAAAGQPQSYWQSLREGFDYIRHTAGMPWLALVYFVFLFFLQQYFIIVPLIVREILNAGVGWVGVLETSFSLAVMGVAFTLSMRSRYRRIYHWYGWGVLATGLTMLATVAIDSGWLMAADFVLFGAAYALVWALSSVIFQHVVPEELKGRFFSVLGTMAGAVVPLSYIAAGGITEVWGIHSTLLINGAGLTALALLVALIPRVIENID
ncbi:MAG: MFS transporter [Negativicutes bacterium]|nr:MFS transporter [Negativicutes bacterium]